MGKRNRIEHAYKNVSSDDDNADCNDGELSGNTPENYPDSDDNDNDNDVTNNLANNPSSKPAATTKAPKKKIRRLKLASTESFNDKLKKRGVLYLARVPPRMGPSKVKTLLSDFGSITRIYLAEEDKTIRKKRRKAGGSGGKRYTEGWVEFESKKVAKLVGETLNMTRVANQKGSIHYDDMWSVKYLRGFKWSHLTEKVAYERRVREQKLRVEMMEVRRENAVYMAQVDAGKKLDHIEERRKRRGKEKVGSGGAEGGGGIPKNIRKIRQKKPFEGDQSLTKSAILGSLI